MYRHFFKRLIDILFSFFGLIILSPFLLIFAIIIKCDSKGHVLFKQVRVGRRGKLFKIWKFRTMVENAEAKGLQISSSDDVRITRSGKWLRRTKIDELPQLFNVLFGQMSLVGPRPEVPKYVEMYTEEQKKVLSVRPGITDLASIEYRHENDIMAQAEDKEATYINEIMPAKLELNKKYIEKITFFRDIKLIFKTVFGK